jgi:hypothetical protein
MTFGSPEAEALDGGYAQKGFGVSSIDGSPFPRAQQPLMKPQRYQDLFGGWRSLDAAELETLWLKRQSNPKRINISDNQ